MNLGKIAASLVLAAEAKYPSSGYYVVGKPFHMGLGGWSVRFNEGQILMVQSDTSLWRWNIESEKLLPVGTPVEGSPFRFRWNGEDDWQLTEPFAKNTKKISSSEFKKLTEEMVVDGVMRVENAIRLLQKADPKANVYIRLKK